MGTIEKHSKTLQKEWITLHSISYGNLAQSVLEEGKLKLCVRIHNIYIYMYNGRETPFSSKINSLRTGYKITLTKLAENMTEKMHSECMLPCHISMNESMFSETECTPKKVFQTS